MALDADNLKNEIKNAIKKKNPDMTKETLKTVGDSWETIAKVLVKHIQDNLEVTINIPITITEPAISFSVAGRAQIK